MAIETSVLTAVRAGERHRRRRRRARLATRSSSSRGARAADRRRRRRHLDRRFLPPAADRELLSRKVRRDRPGAPALRRRQAARWRSQDCSIARRAGRVRAPWSARRGCGKSTLLKLVSGLHRPPPGTVAVAGRAVTGPHHDRRHGVPERDAAAVAHHARQRAAAARGRRAAPPHLPPRSAQHYVDAARDAAAHGRPRRVRGAATLAALGRHAAAQPISAAP